MSTLDDDYLSLVESLYAALGEPTNNHPDLDNVLTIVSGDITGGPSDSGYILHRKEALTRGDLDTHELALAVGRSNDGGDFSIDGDEYSPAEDSMGGTAFLKPAEGSSSDSLYPKLANAHPNANLTPRNKRVPLYDALEQFFTNLAAKNHPLTDDAIMNKITGLLNKIRAVVCHDYRCIFNGVQDHERKAQSYADAYMRTALNAVNVSKTGKNETIKDLICRKLLDSELFEQEIERLQSQNHQKYGFLVEMKTAAEVNRLEGARVGRGQVQGM